MYFISNYKKACTAEWLKLKGSGLFLLTLIMAAFIPVIFTIVSLAQSESGITSVNVANPWKELIGNCFGGFGGFFFPVFLTLVVIRLTQMEHRSGGWKLIETQPVSKISLYLGKFSMSVVVAFGCILALVIFSLLSGVIMMLAKSGSGFSKSSIPFSFIFDLGFRLLISGLGILGIQFLFSVVISGFLGPFGIGLAATITGSILTSLGIALWWPWSAPALTITNPDGSTTGKFLMYYEWLSIAWMILALWLGFQWYQRKTLKRAFFKPASRLAYVLIPVAVFAVFFRYINKPVQLPSHNRTLIAGVFETKENIQKAYLLAEPLYDTVLEIPVEKNRFHFYIDKKILPSEYYFKAGSLSPQKIFFGSKDSLNIIIKSDGKSLKVTSSGNRLPENEYIRKNESPFNVEFNYMESYGYEMKSDVFAAAVMRNWRKEISKVDDYKTADNLKPADDFIALQKKLLSLRYLWLLDIKYAQWFKIYHPNETLIFPKITDDIRGIASYNDSSLLSFSLYRNIMTDYIQQTKRLSLSNDTAYIAKAIRVLPPGPVRDYLIYNRMKEAIGRTIDSVKKETLMANYITTISQINMRQALFAQHYLLKSLNRGKLAPDFQTTALNKDSISLEDFKGRYVVIDVWATWCGPCKVQSPNFERLAEQYTNPKLAFVALSVDDNHWNWRNEANEKSPRVLQLIANNKDALKKSYGLDGIPRFILLGPEGRIINAQMPYPSDPEFENMLRREIPGLERL